MAFAVADFIPPTKPSWDAEQVAHFYQEHTTRIRAGAAILMIAGGFYLPFSLRYPTRSAVFLGYPI